MAKKKPALTRRRAGVRRRSAHDRAQRTGARRRRRTGPALPGTGGERTAGEDVEFVWLSLLPTLAEAAWGGGSRDGFGWF